MSTAKELLSRAALARQFGVSERTINRWWAQRLLPRTRIGNVVGTRPVDLEKALQKRTQPAL